MSGSMPHRKTIWKDHLEFKIVTCIKKSLYQAFRCHQIPAEKVHSTLPFHNHKMAPCSPRLYIWNKCTLSGNRPFPSEFKNELEPSGKILRNPTDNVIIFYANYGLNCQSPQWAQCSEHLFLKTVMFFWRLWKLKRWS